MAELLRRGVRDGVHSLMIKGFKHIFGSVSIEIDNAVFIVAVRGIAEIAPHHSDAEQIGDLNDRIKIAGNLRAVKQILRGKLRIRKLLVPVPLLKKQFGVTSNGRPAFRVKSLSGLVYLIIRFAFLFKVSAAIGNIDRIGNGPDKPHRRAHKSAAYSGFGKRRNKDVVNSLRRCRPLAHAAVDIGLANLCEIAVAVHKDGIGKIIKLRIRDGYTGHIKRVLCKTCYKLLAGGIKYFPAQLINHSSDGFIRKVHKRREHSRSETEGCNGGSKGAVGVKRTVCRLLSEFKSGAFSAAVKHSERNSGSGILQQHSGKIGSCGIKSACDLFA